MDIRLAYIEIISKDKLEDQLNFNKDNIKLLKKLEIDKYNLSLNKVKFLQLPYLTPIISGIINLEY